MLIPARIAWLACGLFAALVLPAAAGPNPDGVAVIIGNRGYQGRVPSVSYAHRDADAFRRHVVEDLGFRPENVIDLRDATQAQMFSVFGNAQDHRGRLWSFVRPERSDVVVYYSGHGVPGQRDRRGYLLPSDADAATPEINGYGLDTLYANLERLQARSVRVFIDACFSGDSQAGTLIESASPVHLRAQPATVPAGVVVLTAASADQLASWDDEARHGLFTHHLLTALRGAADDPRWGDGDGTVSLAELRRYLDDEMSYAARRLFRREQTATVVGPPDMVLAAVPRPAEAAPPPPAPPPASPPLPATRPAPPAPSAESLELAFWRSVADSERAGDLEAYLARYPDGVFAGLARDRLAALRQPEPALAPPPPQPAPAAPPQAAPPPAVTARLAGHDGRWRSADDRLSIVVSGGGGELSFKYRGLTYTTSVGIDADGALSSAYINFNAQNAVQFRGRLPDVRFEIFGRDYDEGVIRLRREGPS